MAACRPFTNDEVRHLMSVLISPRDRLLLFLGILTGFRISELLSIRVSDVIEVDGTCKDHLSVQRKNMKKKTKSRTVLLPDIHELLNPWIARMERLGFVQSSDYLFINSDGKPTSRTNAYRIIKRAGKKCSLRGVIGTHSMRKTFAARVHEANKRKDPGDAMLNTRDALGHKSIASTEKYLESCYETVDSSINEHQTELMHFLVKTN